MPVADPTTTAAPEVGTQGAAPALDEVLDDLAMRFVINCPVEEQESFERLLFQVEAAFWFYEDQYREIWPTAFPQLTLLTFSQRMFKSCPLLAPLESKTKEIYTAFTNYKAQIPTCGAAILNPSCTKVLLVKAYHGHSWGFPKGKIDKGETKSECAMREVLEEVGFDISALIDTSAHVEHQWKDQKIRLYVVAGVPEDTSFVTRTKKEIGEIAWHKLKELPASPDEAKDEARKKFWMVAPFVGKLRRYLGDQQKKGRRLKGQKPAPAPSAAPSPSAAPPQPALPPHVPTPSAGKALLNMLQQPQPHPHGVAPPLAPSVAALMQSPSQPPPPPQALAPSVAALLQPGATPPRAAASTLPAICLQMAATSATTTPPPSAPDELLPAVVTLMHQASPPAPRPAGPHEPPSPSALAPSVAALFSSSPPLPPTQPPQQAHTPTSLPHMAPTALSPQSSASLDSSLDSSRQQHGAGGPVTAQVAATPVPLGIKARDGRGGKAKANGNGGASGSGGVVPGSVRVMQRPIPADASAATSLPSTPSAGETLLHMLQQPPSGPPGVSPGAPPGSSNPPPNPLPNAPPNAPPNPPPNAPPAAPAGAGRKHQEPAAQACQPPPPGGSFGALEQELLQKLQRTPTGVQQPAAAVSPAPPTVPSVTALESEFLKGLEQRRQQLAHIS